MTAEADLWNVTRKNLAPYGMLVRIESPLTRLGIPDVSYCLLGNSGWLELKALKSWPLRATTPLRIAHLKLEQVLFLEGWTRARGRADLLLKVDRTYLVLTPELVRTVYDRQATRETLEKRATAIGVGAFPTVAVLKALGVGIKINAG